MSFHEGCVLFLFTAALILWFFQEPGFMTGWADKLETTNATGQEVSVSDATTAILIAVFCLWFLILFPLELKSISDMLEQAEEPSLSERLKHLRPYLHRKHSFLENG